MTRRILFIRQLLFHDRNYNIAKKLKILLKNVYFLLFHKKSPKFFIDYYNASCTPIQHKIQRKIYREFKKMVSFKLYVL